MKGSSMAGLIGLIALRAVASIPRAAANAAGFGFKKTFEIGGKTVARPERFSTKAHKRAFEDVGRYVTDALTRDVLLSYMDKDLTRKGGIFDKSDVPVEVWHEVLEFFEAEGCLFHRWELGLPSYGEHLSVPSWTADGGRFEEKPKVSAIAGLVPDGRAFEPSLLTDEQKAELLGKPYALHPADSIGPGSWQKPAQEYVTLEEKHFARVFVRKREQLTEESLKKGAETLREVFASQAE